MALNASGNPTDNPLISSPSINPGFDRMTPLKPPAAQPRTELEESQRRGLRETGLRDNLLSGQTYTEKGPSASRKNLQSVRTGNEDKSISCVNYLYAMVGLAALAVVTAVAAAVILFATALPIAVAIGLVTVAALSTGGALFTGYKHFFADKT